MTKDLEEKTQEQYVQKTTDLIVGLVGMGFSYDLNKGQIYLQTKLESNNNKLYD